jgi:hypothetical protein
MPAVDDLSAIRRLLDVPPPTDDVAAAGRARLEELMSGDGGGQRPRRASRRAATSRVPRIGVFVTAVGVAAAAAAVAAALTVAHPRPAPSGAAQRGKTPRVGATATAPGSVTQAILTAIGSVDGDVMHLSVSTSGGPPVGRGVVQYWWWPAKPAPGQQVHLVFFGASTRLGVTFTEPVATSGNATLHMVSASGFLLVPAAKTWQRISQFADEGVFASTVDDLLDEGYLRSTYLPRSRVLNEHSVIDHRRAIEISAPAVASLRILLWVDAHTYLPVRQVKLETGVSYPETRKVYDYQFRPATPANLTPVTLTIPRGYKPLP